MPNAGRKNAPRVRRADLPRKATKINSTSSYDPGADAAAILGRRS